MKSGRWLETVSEHFVPSTENEGFPSFCLCASVFCVEVQKVEWRARTTWLRTATELMLFLACVCKVLLN